MGLSDEKHFFDVSSPGYKGVEKKSFSGADVSVVFSIHGSNPSFKAGDEAFQTAQLQTITMSSTTSIYPVRRMGEAAPVTYNKGARTFAGSMVFTILGSDPLQKIFSVDAIKSAARTDRHWHVDQMPPIDCLLLFATESGSSGMQMIHDMQITNWGEVVSIDDLYLEVTYTFMAEHMTPFISSDYMASVGSSRNKTQRALDQILNFMHDGALVPDDAVSKVLEIYDDDIKDTYGAYLRALLSGIFAKYTARYSGLPYDNESIELQSAFPLGLDGNRPKSNVFIALQAGPEMPPEIYDLLKWIPVL